MEVRTFAEAMVLTHDEGLVIYTTEGQRIFLTVHADSLVE